MLIKKQTEYRIQDTHHSKAFIENNMTYLFRRTSCAFQHCFFTKDSNSVGKRGRSAVKSSLRLTNLSKLNLQCNIHKCIDTNDRFICILLTKIFFFIWRVELSGFKEAIMSRLRRSLEKDKRKDIVFNKYSEVNHFSRYCVRELRKARGSYSY